MSGQTIQDRLKETLARMNERTEAYRAEIHEREKALAWCRANGDPHLK